MEIAATCVLPGTNRGRLLSTQQPISFWGCVDPLTGNISDRRHELFGESISEKVLVFPFGKGSSTGSLMILELLRLDLAPAAIINVRTEPLLATGPVVGKHFDDARHTIQTGYFARTQASFSGCKFIASVNLSHNQRLNEALFFDGL